ncbi:glycosyltransferase family 4 protein [Rubritalea sp.]|uniref:glycosyltransferase family 4 protein n=1 Tax=Rubritalea sp. TaxID=2109375 RepID=UPI003EF52632
MHKRCEILIVGQTPPPFHGQSIVTQILFEHDWADLDVERLRMVYSDKAEDIGVFKLKKIGHLFSLILKTWLFVTTRKPICLYYLPASPSLVPVIRDLVYLLSVRWLFPKTIFHFHAGGLDEYIEALPIIGRVARFVYRGADLSIDVNRIGSPSGAYFKAKKNVVIMNGVDVHVLPRSREAKLFRILSVGLLCEEKGVLEVIKTAAVLRDANVLFEFVFVGDWVSEEFRGRVHALLVQQSLREQIIFTGPLHGDSKWKEYADADIFLFASHHPTETFGMVLVEAMANSLAVVATKWRGVASVVSDQKTAILCDPKSPELLAEAILKLKNDPELREKMGFSGRERYLQNYTKACFLRKMEAAFLEVCR